jgi:hypothetical protein
MNINVENELKRQQEEALAEERKQFVREAAIRLACAVDTGPGTHQSFGRSCLMSTADEAWALAMALWDAKPEGC